MAAFQCLQFCFDIEQNSHPESLITHPVQKKKKHRVDFNTDVMLDVKLCPKRHAAAVGNLECALLAVPGLICIVFPPASSCRLWQVCGRHLHVHSPDLCTAVRV